MKISDILEKYAEIDKKFIEESLKNPHKTEWITMRVPVHVKEFYRKLPAPLKKAVRETFMNLVVNIFMQYASGNIPEIPSNTNIVVNVQAPPIIINNVQNNNNVEVKVDLGEALATIRELKQLIYNWYRHNAIPTPAYKRAYSKLKKIEEIISRAN